MQKSTKKFIAREILILISLLLLSSSIFGIYTFLKEQNDSKVQRLNEKTSNPDITESFPTFSLAYSLFQKNGYDGNIVDFFKVIKDNPDAYEDAYSLYDQKKPFTTRQDFDDSILKNEKLTKIITRLEIDRKQMNTEGNLLLGRNKKIESVTESIFFIIILVYPIRFLIFLIKWCLKTLRDN
jgi:hypothetical protein